MAKTVANIFICYRHDDDPGNAGRLADALGEHFPKSHVFRDVEGLESGTDFTKVIKDNLASCAAFLAVIGPRWLEKETDGPVRLHDPQDFVRLELGTALAHGTFLNGSVPTVRALLEPPQCRPATFYRGFDVLDQPNVGFVSRRCEAPVAPVSDGCPVVEVQSGCMPEDAGWRHDVTDGGNGNGGHLYGTDLGIDEKTALVEFLKQL